MGSVHQITISQDINLHILDDYLLPQAREKADQYQVDLSKAQFISAPGGVILLLFLQYLKQRSKNVIVIPPENKSLFIFLGQINFYTLLQNMNAEIVDEIWLFEPLDPMHLAKKTILEIKYISAKMTPEGYQNWLSKSIENTIIDKINNLSHQNIKDLSRIFWELTSNVHEHSLSFGYTAAQRIQNKLGLCVGDLGIGIFQSLSPFYHDNCDKFEQRFGPLWDEPKSLDIAFARGVSSKSSEGRGLGLSTILSIVKQEKGAVIIRSGKTKLYLGYRHNKWTNEKKVDLEYFPGTQLEVYV